MRLLKRVRSLIPVLATAMVQTVCGLALLARSRTALVAENLFLRKQLAFYQQRQARPRRLTDAARFSLTLWSRLFDWREALVISANEATASAVKSMPFWFRVLLILRAATFEELFYRGFAIERLTELTRLRWLASLISVTAFTLAHLNTWGWAHLMIAGFGGMVLTGLYLFRRDLASNMIAHFLTDAVGFLLG